MAQLTQNRDSTSSAIEELQQARRQLLPDEANPALLIDQATNEIHQSQTQLASCRTSYAEKRNQLKAIAHNIQEVKQKITDNQLVVDQAYKTLTQSLHQHGFRDINAYHVAILPPSERAQLQATKEQLKRDTDLAEQDLKQLGEQLAKISTQYSDIATWDDDTQQEAIAKAQADSEQLAQEIAKLQAQKHTIEAKQAEHQARYEALQTLKKEALVWQQLNDLIGSATGKKFRNYVQEIHLQHLLDYANAQLNKMHKRYELVVSLDEQTKLGIDIIDYAQGGQTRSTKNLSGGEQFIISLALALGLSQFSSQNRPIYSLFLDEGFGTLDDTHLAIALSTLNELHNAGKTIGIISHVPSLKEQISTQISVKKQANGESIISGQGVSRLS